MTADGMPDGAAPRGQTRRDPPTLRGIMARHKGASAVAIVVVLLLIAFSVAAAISSSSTAALSDSTSCSQWVASREGQQNAYAQLYLKEHGAPSSAARTADAVRSTITSTCTQAAYLGESDDVSVVAAINHDY
jgi:hypothetical protein